MMPGFAHACVPLLVYVAHRRQMTKVTGISYFASIMQKFSALKLSKIQNFECWHDIINSHLVVACIQNAGTVKIMHKIILKPHV